MNKKPFTSTNIKVQSKLNKEDKGIQKKDPRMISSTGIMDLGPVDFKSRISEHEGQILTLATREVVTLPPTKSIMDAIKKMTEKGFRRVPITDAGTNRLEGIVTTVDIIDFLGGGSKNLLVEKRFKGNLLAAINEEIREIMQYDAVYLHEEATLSDAISTMINKNTGGIPIVNDNMQVTGIFTERNVVELMGGIVVNKKVEDYMSRKVKMVSTDTPIRQAAKLMVENRFRRLPVVRDGTFAGMVTATDIMRFLGSGEAFNKLVTGNIHEAFDQPVDSIASKELIWTSPETDIGKALEILREKKIGSLPVIEEGIIRGIITERDFLKSFK